MPTKHILAGAMALAFCVTPALSADLGGNCCADLEERIAELEATTARKGNRKASLTISGQVSRTIFWNEATHDWTVGADNANSPSRITLHGTAKITPQVTAGYVLEYGTPGGSGASPELRHAFVYVESQIGKLSLGQASMATDGVAEISLANTHVANLPTVLYGPIIDGDRRQIVRYDTPTLAGFTASASVANGEVWDLALRWAGEHSGYRAAAAIGFADHVAYERWSGSASIMHMATGLFANVVAGRSYNSGNKLALHTTVGIEKKWLDLGRTTLFVEAGRQEISGVDADVVGFGVVQAIDNAAMDLFATYRDIDGVSVVMAGTRIRF